MNKFEFRSLYKYLKKRLDNIEHEYVKELINIEVTRQDNYLKSIFNTNALQSNYTRLYKETFDEEYKYNFKTNYSCGSKTDIKLLERNKNTYGASITQSIDNFLNTLAKTYNVNVMLLDREQLKNIIKTDNALKLLLEIIINREYKHFEARLELAFCYIQLNIEKLIKFYEVMYEREIQLIIDIYKCIHVCFINTIDISGKAKTEIKNVMDNLSIEDFHDETVTKYLHILEKVIIPIEEAINNLLPFYQLISKDEVTKELEKEFDTKLIECAYKYKDLNDELRQKYDYEMLLEVIEDMYHSIEQKINQYIDQKYEQEQDFLDKMKRKQMDPEWTLHKYANPLYKAVMKRIKHKDLKKKFKLVGCNESSKNCICFPNLDSEKINHNILKTFNGRCVFEIEDYILHKQIYDPLTKEFYMILTKPHTNEREIEIQNRAATLHASVKIIRHLSYDNKVILVMKASPFFEYSPLYNIMDRFKISGCTITAVDTDEYNYFKDKVGLTEEQAIFWSEPLFEWKVKLMVIFATPFLAVIKRALKKLHNNGIFHRDLYAVNTWINLDNQVLFTDFGFAIEKNKREKNPWTIEFERFQFYNDYFVGDSITKMVYYIQDKQVNVKERVHRYFDIFADEMNKPIGNFDREKCLKLI